MTKYDMLMYLFAWGMFVIGVVLGYTCDNRNPFPGETTR